MDMEKVIQTRGLRTSFPTFLAFALFVSLSCNDDETVANGGDINVPVYASTPNVFTYSINAVNLSTVQTIPLNFVDNRLQTVTTVQNRNQGYAVFALSDSTAGIFHADTFRLPGLYHSLAIVGVPVSARITLQDFTGRIQYTVVGDSTTRLFHVVDFPTLRDTRWLYAVYDSMSLQDDTLRVTILGDTVLQGNIASTIWQYEYRVRTEMEFVSTICDTVRMYRPPLLENTKYIFPLMVGRGWRGDYSADTSLVLHSGSVITPAGTFSEGFLVKNSRWTPLSTAIVDHTWLVPGVGIVKRHRKEADGLGWERVTTWELYDFNVSGVLTNTSSNSP